MNDIYFLFWNANISNSRSESDHAFVSWENEIKSTFRFLLPCNEPNDSETNCTDASVDKTSFDHFLSIFPIRL